MSSNATLNRGEKFSFALAECHDELRILQQDADRSHEDRGRLEQELKQALDDLHAVQMTLAASEAVAANDRAHERKHLSADPPKRQLEPPPVQLESGELRITRPSPQRPAMKSDVVGSASDRRHLINQLAEEEVELRSRRAAQQDCAAALSATRAKLDHLMQKQQSQMKPQHAAERPGPAAITAVAPTAAAVGGGAFPAIAPTRPLARGITLAVHMDPSRLRLEMKEIPERWAGPIAVAFFAASPDDQSLVHRLMGQLSASVRARVDYSVYAYWNPHNESAYPVNEMRNQALALVRTELVLLIDGDFVPDDSLFEFFAPDNARYDRLEKQAREGRTAFVVPCFMQTMRFNPRPVNHTGLLAAWGQTIVPPGDPSDRPHHGPTDYPRWRTSTEIYPIDYKFWYEPYVVVSMRTAPLWDPRFVYYGADKCIYAYALHRSGFQFKTVPRHFIIHVPHPRDPWYADLPKDEGHPGKPEQLLRHVLENEWQDNTISISK